MDILNTYKDICKSYTCNGNYKSAETAHIHKTRFLINEWKLLRVLSAIVIVYCIVISVTSWCSGRLIGSPRQGSRVQDPISTNNIHEGGH
jgi:hypothetical protein